jgi:dihydroorotase
MSSTLLKNICIYDPRSPLNGQLGDLSLKDGKIDHFGHDISESGYDEVFDFTDCMVTPSFVDMRCNSSDPGYEQRETIESLSRCAEAGGYSHLALLPNSLPPRQSKTDIESIIRKSKKHVVEFLPLGAITLGLNTDELAEMYDMKINGAVAFSNGNNAIENIGTMSRALQYSKSFEGLIYSFCRQEELSKGAYVTEGTVAVSLGLKGIPQMAEFLQVQRDIELADYHQTRLHISKISTERSVEMVRQAKAQGTKVTCDVAIMNLVLTDETIMDFDSNLKLNPPLRQANDVKALWEGLQDGTIDAICSDHHPQEIEHKDVEFEYASYGAISLQIALSLAIEGRNRFFPSMSDEVLFSKFNVNPAAILKVELPLVDIGQECSFVVINPHQQTKLSKRNNLSKSENTYYLNKPLPYCIEATIIGNNSLFNKR